MTPWRLRNRHSGSLRARPWVAAAALVVATLFALAAPSPAVAQDFDTSATAKHHYERGQQLYQDEQYARAADELRKAYALSPAPMLLYNIALAEWRAGQLETALHAAKRARDDGIDRRILPQVDARIAALRTMLAARGVAGAVEDDAADPPKVVELDEPTPRERESSFGVLGWTGSGLAAAGLGLGLGSLYINHRLAQDARGFEAAALEGNRTEYDRRLNDLENRQFVGRLMAVGGVALGATGLTLLVLEFSGETSDQPHPTARLLATPTEIGFSVSY